MSLTSKPFLNIIDDAIDWALASFLSAELTEQIDRPRRFLTKTKYFSKVAIRPFILLDEINDKCPQRNCAKLAPLKTSIYNLS